MRIGRLAFGIIKGQKHWGYEKSNCLCRMLELGRVWIMLSDKTCKCGECKQYACICPCELCDKKFVDCDCEKFDANS